MAAFLSHLRSATGNYNGGPTSSFSSSCVPASPLCPCQAAPLHACFFSLSQSACVEGLQAEQSKLISACSRRSNSRVSCSTGCSHNSVPTCNAAGMCWVRAPRERTQHEDHKEGLSQQQRAGESWSDVARDGASEAHLAVRTRVQCVWITCDRPASRKHQNMM